MFPESHCQACHAFAKFLAAPSDPSTFINYFRCPHCGIVWTQPKIGFSGERQLITLREESVHA